MALSLQPSPMIENKHCFNFNCFDGLNQVPISTLQKNNRGQPMMKETEDILASEFVKLTVEERREALDDLHCVGVDLKESPEMIEELLVAFDHAVQLEQDPLYEMLLKHHKTYLESRSFRLRFIRANMQNVGRAVSQMMHFLRNKQRYFGDDFVGREISFDNLNEEDRELLFSGIYHIQKDKDRNSRAILYFFSEFIGNARPETFCRVAYYVYFNILIAMPEVQMKGLVFIYYDVTKVDELPSMPGMKLTVAIMDMIRSLPIRFSAMHFCLKTRQEKLKVFNSMFLPVFKLSPHYGRVRTRMHYGSDMELRYQLRSHGIDIGSCPIDVNGALREDIKHAWFFEHLKKERSNIDPMFQPSLVSIVEDAGSGTMVAQDYQMVEKMKHNLDIEAEAFFGNRTTAHREVNGSASSTVTAAKSQKISGHSVCRRITPTDEDILLGRGRVIQYNPGNVRFRKFLVAYKEDYDTAPRRGRKEIITEVTRVLRSKGVRFLKQIDDDVWVESNEKEIEKKIMQLFREYRKNKL